MQLNFEILNERLSQLDLKTALVNYIYKTQGDELRRLDYGAAAHALGVDWHTISKNCDQLAALKIIVFEDKKLKLNRDIIAG